MKKRIFSLALAVILAIGGINLPGAGQVEAAGTTTTVTYEVSYPGGESDLLNAEKAGFNFVEDSNLSNIAKLRAAQLAIFYVKNVTPAGDTATTVYGYDSELILMGPSTASSIYSSWRGDITSAFSAYSISSQSGSSGTQTDTGSSETVEPATLKTGIGHVMFNNVHYWVQVFDEGQSTSTSAPGTKITQAVANSIGTVSATLAETSAYKNGVMTVRCTEELPLPDAAVTLTITDSRDVEHSGAIPVIPAKETAWKSASDVFATVSGSGSAAKVKGVASGTINLTASIYLSDVDVITQTVKLTITPYNLSEANITFAQQSYPLAGKTAEPDPIVTMPNGVTLTKNTDYTVSYSNNTAVGKGTCTVTAVEGGKYTGKKDQTFTIVEDPGGTLSSSNTKVYTTKSDAIIYDKTEKKPDVTVERNGVALDASSYDVTYASNVNAGTARIIVTGKGKYSGTVTGTFKIDPLSISDATITFGASNYTYTGEAVIPDFTVKAGSIELSATDYTASYADNKAVSTSGKKASVTVTGKGNFKDSKKAEFTIEKGTLNGGRIEYLNASTGMYETTYTATYDGRSHVPTMRVTLNDGKVWLTEGSQYTITQAGDTVNVGTVTVTATGQGDFAGSTLTGTYTIAAKDASALTITNPGNKTFTGKEQTPEVTVKDGGLTLKADTDYTISYSNNTYPGTATITATLSGNYTGTIETSFKIKMKKPTLSKVTGGKGRFSAVWKSPGGIFSKYQIQYSKSSSMSGGKKVTVSKSNLKATVKKLAKGNYYVRVRTFFKDDSGKYYSAWSAKKKVTVS